MSMVHLKFVLKEIISITREQQCTIFINKNYNKYSIKIQIGTSYYIFRIFGGKSGLIKSVNINNFQYKYSWIK